MDDAKRKRLEAAGYTIGTLEEFLGLTPEEGREIDEALARILLKSDRQAAAPMFRFIPRTRPKSGRTTD